MDVSGWPTNNDLTNISFERTLDAVWSTYQVWWMIAMDGENERIRELPAINLIMMMMISYSKFNFTIKKRMRFAI